MPSFELRFKQDQVLQLAARYIYPTESIIEDEVGPRSRERGYFTKSDFVALCYWKSPRTQSRVKTNSSELVEDATCIALSTPNEELRIGVLTLLHGVSWPTASTILHFAHRDPYPILDFRALWSLGIDSRPSVYAFDFWWKYTLFCRKLAKECRVSMRVLDRALWQFSKENQLPQE